MNEREGVSHDGTAAATSVAVADEDAGDRLDALLAKALPELSRSRWKAVILGGGVTSRGAAVTDPSRKVAAGEVFAVAVPEPEDPEPQGEDIPLHVVYEDDDLLVIDKSAGLVVHPGAGNWTGTLVNALIHHCGDTLSGIGGVKRPGIVHRLDKDTSGLMVVAKTDAAHQGLAAQFADHGREGPLERAYLALVWGTPALPRGTVEAAIARSTADRQKMAVSRAESARHAITHYEVVRRHPEASGASAMISEVECRLETGRTHQIRVHMAHIGHPVVGDPDYATGFRTKAARLPPRAAAAVRAFPRQALHAVLLGFEHPVTGEHLRFESRLPPDMAGLIAAIEAWE